MPSSEANAPLMSPDMMRNAAMYCATRTLITSHPAHTTSSVMKALRMTNSTEMPSTPRW